MPTALPSRLIVTDMTARRQDCEVARAVFVSNGPFVVIVQRWIKTNSLTGRLECSSENVFNPIQSPLSPRLSVPIGRCIRWRGNQPVQHVFENLTCIGNGRIIVKEHGEESTAAVGTAKRLTCVLDCLK
jgi:hypothetical protein